MTSCVGQLPVGADRFGYCMNTKAGNVVHERRYMSSKHTHMLFCLHLLSISYRRDLLQQREYAVF
jgi:hypothetical protein